MSSTQPILAIDYGERRVGLAINIPGMDFVSGLPTIDRRSLKRSLAEEIAVLVAERGVGRVVIGIPFTLAGEAGPAARATREFAAELAGALAVPVEEWDERLTTEAARRALRDSGRSERDMKERVDQVAAVLLLEGYLRSRASEPESA